MGWYSSPQEVGNLSRSYHLSLGLPLRDVKVSLSGYAAFDRGYLRKVVRSSSAPFCRRATLLHLMIPIGRFSSRRNLDVSQRSMGFAGLCAHLLKKRKRTSGNGRGSEEDRIVLDGKWRGVRGKRN